MTAKQFLRQYEEAHRLALRYKTEYEKEMELVDSVRSTLGGDGMPHGSGVSRKVEDQAIRLGEKAMEYKQAMENAIRVRQEVFDVIHDIPGIEGDVLYYRYLCFMEWDKIADKLSYTVRSIYYAHGRALQIVRDRLQ